MSRPAPHSSRRWRSTGLSRRSGSSWQKCCSSWGTWRGSSASWRPVRAGSRRPDTPNFWRPAPNFEAISPGSAPRSLSGLATAPGHPGLLLQRAQIDLADGHPAEALEHLDRAVAADPYRPETIYQRGVVLQQLGRTEEARRDLARADELNKGLAEMSDLNRQAERAPHDADVRYRLGRLCVDLGKPELAASWYRAALACDPGHAAARFGLKALRPTGRIGGPGP